MSLRPNRKRKRTTKPKRQSPKQRLAWGRNSAIGSIYMFRNNAPYINHYLTKEERYHLKQALSHIQSISTGYDERYEELYKEHNLNEKEGE